MPTLCKYFFSFFLLVLTPLSGYYPESERDRLHAPREDVQIYNENYYPTYANPYYGYQPILPPTEVFPDDAEANYLFEKMHE